ncbi:ATP-binding cassette domain-containing protein [Alicyclobacillus fastidiosus]|uniref:ATP-binding cassette domain-containing protein n=1 Tax=Alicyclobacillus fastidiosus TaxID=392011 RepID=A0ABV5AF37_9BACL|nr:ATP-binding cassette domain-containing protein [Alicyclobacillus fastidiosus]WEH09419.1 ATP-binding cassette domain-containing protein [Alicyclobacillus fastidiosus]
MIVLQVSHVKKSYDTVDVLHDASLMVRLGDKLGLVGRNGAGKSTLVRIVTGQEQPDSGHVTWREGTTVGYVSQFVDPPEHSTVYSFVAQARAHLEKMEQNLRKYEQQMADPDVYQDEARFEQLSTAYDTLSRRFQDEGGYAWQTDIRRVLSGLQFPREMHEMPVSSLSGGQKTRLSLARLLAAQPDLLVLDEPTNYLDTETLTWLEQFLKGYSGSVLVVSHDRYFLDEITTHTVELEQGVTTSYTGNYEAYMEQKVEARLRQAKQFAQQQEEIAKIELFVAKNLARASTTKRAQSRRKMLERMERFDQPEGDQANVHLAFAADRPSGRDVLRVSDVSIGYEEHVLANNVSFRLERGMRLAVLGPNGAGKSTLMKTLLLQIEPLRGAIDVGQHVQVGYYDQEQSDLDPTKTVLSQVWDEHPQMDRTTVRSALAQFLFRGNDVDKPVAGLSGGERSRLNLCRLMLQRANTLFMDEPTNHLDIPSKEALEAALVDYDGTLLFISHDRYFIDAIATHVGILSKDGLTLYIGNYTDYREKLAENDRIQEIEADSSNKSAKGAPPTAQGNAKSGVKPAAKQEHGPTRRRIRSSDVRKAQEAVERFEQLSTACEVEMEQVATALSEAAQNQDLTRLYELEAQLKDLQARHEDALLRWEQASLDLEQLERDLAAEDVN